MVPNSRSNLDPIDATCGSVAPSRRFWRVGGILVWWLVLLQRQIHAGPVGIDPEVLFLPSPTNSVQMRLFLGTERGARHAFNCFEISAQGQVLLPASPGPGTLGDLGWKACGKSLQSVLLDGNGPNPPSGFSAKVIDDVSGSGWRLLGLELPGAYADADAKVHYRRNLLYVEPGLFVVHDHFEGVDGRRVDWQWHLPSAARLDPAWGDVRLGTTNTGLVMHAPGTSKHPRAIRRIESPADRLLPATMSVGLSITNRETALDLMVVYGVQRSGVPADFAFKWVESNTAVGARIYRDGLPTLVGFRTTAGGGKSSISGFEFDGPVGVSVLRPKVRTAAK